MYGIEMATRRLPHCGWRTGLSWQWLRPLSFPFLTRFAFDGVTVTASAVERKFANRFLGVTCDAILIFPMNDAYDALARGMNCFGFHKAKLLDHVHGAVTLLR
jgi:hypothetical protein